MSADDAPENVWGPEDHHGHGQRLPALPGDPRDTGSAPGRTVPHQRQALSRAKTVTNREIQEVTGPDRLRITGLGETRVLGVRVAAEHREAALGYLRQAVAGKRLAVTVAAGQDPERRPLVVMTPPNGTSVNAGLIQRGLAQTWKAPGLWHRWAVPEFSASNE